MNDTTLQELIPVPPSGAFGFTAQEIAILLVLIQQLAHAIMHVASARKDGCDWLQSIASIWKGSVRIPTQELPTKPSDVKPDAT